MFAERFERRLDRDRHARAIATVPLVRRTLKVFVAIVAFIAALQNFGFNVTGLHRRASASAASRSRWRRRRRSRTCSAASASSPTSRCGSGDVCRFGDTVGTVEDIGLRSTRVRTARPDAGHDPERAVLDHGAREPEPPRPHPRARDPRAAAGHQRRPACARCWRALRETLAKQPKVDVNSIRTRFVEVEPKALEIELFAYVATSRWDEFVEVREQIFLGALDVVSASGVDLK